MVVSFLSFDNEKNKISFQAEAKQTEHTLEFEDKSTSNTQMRITVHKNSLIVERIGSINMYLHFCLDKSTLGTYKNQEGLEFSFEVHTKTLTIEKNKFKVSYDMVMEEDILSSHTFQVVLFQN